MFDSKLVARSPQDLANNRKGRPKQMFETARERAHKQPHIPEASGVPRVPQPRPQEAPKEFGEMTMEKNMVSRFKLRAKSAIHRDCIVMFADLIRRRELRPKGLPHIDFDLRRDASCPESREATSTSTTNKLIIERFPRESTRGSQRPREFIVAFRNHREYDSKSLPIEKLPRGRQTTKTKVPACRHQLRDGDARLGAIREEGREGISESPGDQGSNQKRTERPFLTVKRTCSRKMSQTLIN